MKARIVLASAFALLCLLPPLTHAAPACVKGTMESYIALGVRDAYSTMLSIPISPTQPRSWAALPPMRALLQPISS